MILLLSVQEEPQAGHQALPVPPNDSKGPLHHTCTSWSSSLQNTKNGVFFSKSLSWVPMPTAWHKGCLPQQAPTGQPPGIRQLAGWHLDTILCRAPNANEMYQTKAFSFKVGQNLPTCPKSNQPTKEAAFRARQCQIKALFFFFFLKVGQNLPNCPNSSQPTKQTGFRARAQIIGVGFFSSKGERVLSPHTPPNSTQSKPNTKPFCSVFEVKIP